MSDSGTGTAQQIDIQAQYRQRALGLRFANAEVDRAFLWSWLHATFRVRALWAILATLIYGAYSTLIAMASSIPFADLHWFRFLVVLPIFAAVTLLVLRKWVTPKLCDVVFVTMSTAAFGNAAWCFATVSGEANLLFLYEMAAIFVCAMLYFPGLFRAIATFIAIGTAISFVAFWYVWLGAGQGWVAIAVQSALLMGLTVAGLTGAYSKEILIRRNYRARRIERAQREEAEQLALAANAASAAKSRFVAMVSHEFRTPLNAIMGYSEILQLQAEASATESRVGDYSRNILSSAQHLHRLVENVLAATSGPDQPLRPNLEPVELNSLTSRVVNANLVKADRRGVHLVQSFAMNRMPVIADQWMAAHMLDELLSNALKFTPAGGSIDVEIAPASNGGGTLQVTDTGTGISDEMQAVMFDQFRQSQEDLNRSYDGLGLGLTLVRKMADAQGIRIHMTSRLGEGTAIRLNFPPAESADSRSAA